MKFIPTFVSDAIEWLFDIFKSSTGARKWISVILLALLLAGAVFLSSCSRTTLSFRGTGTVEMMYKGNNGPSLKIEE